MSDWPPTNVPDDERCEAAHHVEDEASIGDWRCERRRGHLGEHCVTYPGLDGGVTLPVWWHEERGCTEIHQDRVVRRWRKI